VDPGGVHPAVHTRGSQTVRYGTVRSDMLNTVPFSNP